MARFWPSSWRKTVSTPEARSDISIDEWSNYFNFNGNTYNTGSFAGGSGLFAFGGYPSDSGTGNAGNTEESYADFIGHVDGAFKASSVVFSCAMARMSLFTEARFAFQAFDGTHPGDYVAGDGLEILQKPWPGAVTSSLLARAIQDADLHGNAYFVEQFYNGVHRLRRLRPDWVLILLDGDPTRDAYADIVAYVYKPGNTSDTEKWEVFPVDGSNGMVAHWAPIPDPLACYRGMSWLTPIIREITADKAMSLHKVKYFQNGAKPGMVVSYDASISPDQAAAFTEKFNQTKLGVDNAYRPLFFGGGVDVTTLNTGIESFKEVSTAGEYRIASAARVPPMIAGIQEAKSSSLNGGELTASKSLFADGTIRPLWASLCAVLEPLVNCPEGARLWYADTDIAFLREDVQIIASRQSTEAATIASLVQSGFTPESAVKAVRENDWSELDHSGLLSVQLFEPGVNPNAAPTTPATTPDKSSKDNPPAKG